MTMRHYIPHWETIGIKKERYLELLHFCRQYPDWKTEAASLVGPRGVNLDGMPHGSGVGNPTAAAAERRAALLEKIQLVEKCAASVGHGEWYAALILNVCYKRRYSDLDPELKEKSCLSYMQLHRYAGEQGYVYGWHLRDFENWDAPLPVGYFLDSKGNPFKRAPQSWAYAIKM